MRKLLIITLFLISIFTACEQNPALPEPIIPPEQPPSEEESIFDLQWATRMDYEKEIVSTDNTQQYQNWMLVGGDIGFPPTIMAFNKDTGEKDWEFEHSGSVENKILSSLIYENIYLGMCIDGMIAINLDNQTTMWEIDFQQLSRERGTQLILHDGKIYTSSKNNINPSLRQSNILEINPLTGSYRIVYTGTFMSPPVFYIDEVTNEVSFIVNEVPDSGNPPQTATQNIKRVDLITGNTIWGTNDFTEYFASNSGHPPVIYNDIVITGGDWSLYAFDINRGEQLWRTEVPNTLQVGIWTITNHLIYGDKLYANPGGKELLCINPNTGTIIWQSMDASNCSDNMTYYEKEDYLLFGSIGRGSVMIIDALTGETVHREYEYDNSAYTNDVVYDADRDMFFTSTYKHAVGFKVNPPE